MNQESKQIDMSIQEASDQPMVQTSDLHQNQVRDTPKNKTRLDRTGKNRVLALDGHPVPRHGLAQLIKRHTDLTLVGIAETPLEALEMIASTGPDAVISDVALNTSDGLDFIRTIKDKHPRIAVLVFSHQDETVYAPRALRAGAKGYIMKDEPVEIVLEAIRTVLSGDIYLSGRMARRMYSQLVNGENCHEVSRVETLSNRQLEVFEMIGRFLGSREISERLNVSIKTVNAHRAQIKKKLAVHSASELIQHAVAWVQSH